MISKLVPIVGNATLAGITLLIASYIGYSYGTELFSFFSIFTVTNAIFQSLVLSFLVYPFSVKLVSSERVGKEYSLLLVLAFVVCYAVQSAILLIFSELDLVLIYSLMGASMQIRNVYRNVYLYRQDNFRAYGPDFVISFFVVLDVAVSFRYNLSFREFSAIMAVLYLVVVLIDAVSSLKLNERSMGWSDVYLISKRDGWPSLTSAFYMEMANNSYNYIIAFFYGPVVYAYFSAVMMAMRPFGMVSNTINQLSRVRLTAGVAVEEVRKGHFSWNLLVLVANSLVVIFLYLFGIEGVAFDDYFLLWSVFLSIIILLAVRAYKYWEVVVLQSDMQFSSIRKYARPVSIISVVVLYISAVYELYPVIMTVLVIIFDLIFSILLVSTRRKVW
jgi:hypothetical protein